MGLLALWVRANRVRFLDGSLFEIFQTMRGDVSEMFLFWIKLNSLDPILERIRNAPKVSFIRYGVVVTHLPFKQKPGVRFPVSN